ncbi:MAG: tetratricopeptide repeat protein [Anaerolineae bacterium]|nr:tetratricopeptide repeat protein [Anaerolineae bacterium]
MASHDFLQALNEAIRLVQAGHPEQARPILYELSHAHPEQEAVWLWLATVALSNTERIEALQRVLAINPRNAKARTALERLTGVPPTPAPPRLDLSRVKLPEVKLPTFKLPPHFWQSVQTALIVILTGLAAFVVIFLAGSAIVPSLTPPSATPTPTFTRTPRPTVPTPTPRPTLTLPPTWTPEPTVTPRPANTLRPTLTPRPTLTRVPSRTPTPTFTRPPTLTPTPSSTLTPSPVVPTVAPSETPTPI